MSTKMGAWAVSALKKKCTLPGREIHELWHVTTWTHGSNNEPPFLSSSLLPFFLFMPSTMRPISNHCTSVPTLQTAWRAFLTFLALYSLELTVFQISEFSYFSFTMSLSCWSHLHLLHTFLYVILFNSQAKPILLKEFLSYHEDSTWPIKNSSLFWGQPKQIWCGPGKESCL